MMMTETANAERRRFDDLMPWYVNGTASETDRAWIEQYLRDHPEYRSEVQWHKSLQQHIQLSETEVSPDVGLDRLMKKICEDRCAARTAHKAGLGEQLKAFFEGFRLTPAMGLAYSLVLVQMGVILAMLSNMDKPEELVMRSTQPVTVVEEGPYLKLRFQDTARIDEIRALLADAGGTLVRGPDSEGVFYYSIPKWEINRAARSFRTDPSVLSVDVATRLPAPPGAGE